MPLPIKQLKGQELIDYVKANPFDKTIKITNNAGIDFNKVRDQGVQEMEQKNRDSRGVVGNFVYDIGKSLTALPRTYFAALGAKDFLSPEEQQRYSADPTSFAVQSAVNTGSWFVPGVGPAGSLGRLASQAALASGMQAFGNQDLRKGLDVGNIATNAALGAGTGLVLGKVANSIGKRLSPKINSLDNAGEDILTKINKADEFGSASLNKAQSVGRSLKRGNVMLSASEAGSPLAKVSQQDQTLGLLKAFGKKTNTTTDIANGIEEVKQELNNSINPILKNSNISYNGKGLVKEVQSAVGNKSYLLESPEVQSYLKDIARNNISASDLNSIKFEIQNKLTNVYNRFNSTGSTSMTRVQEGLKAIRDVIDTKLANEPALASYKPVLDKLSLIHDVQGQLNKVVDKGGTKIGTSLVYGVKAPIGGVFQRGRNLAGNILEGNMANPWAAKTNLRGISPVIAANINTMTNGSRAPIDYNTQQPTSGDVTQQQSQNQEVATQQTGIDPKQALMMAAQMNGGKLNALTLSLANYLMTANGGASGGKALPAAQSTQLSDTKSGIDMLDSLQNVFNQSRDAFDPIMGSLRSLNPYDTQATNANAVIYQVRQIIGKGLEGGVLRKEDEEKYAHMLPKLSDTPATVQNKIDTLKATLINKFNNQIKGLELTGYNPGYSTIQ